MLTVRDIVTSALRKIQVIGAGEVPTADDLRDAITALNLFLETWSLEVDPINVETRELFPLTAGITAYTLGPGGSMNTTRPVTVLAAFLRQNGADTPIDLYDAEQYARIGRKAASGDPMAVYVDNASPLRNLILSSAPGAGRSLGLYSVKPLVAFASGNDQVAFPDGYARAIIHNLAVELAPEYERPVPVDVGRIARQSKAVIVRANNRGKTNASQVDPALLAIGRCR